VIVWDTPATEAAHRALPWSPDYELRLDAVYKDALEESLAKDPFRPIRLLPAKFLFYWTADFTHPKGRNPAAWLPWMLILPAVIWGIRALWRRRALAWPLYFWPGFYLVIVLVLFALPRYRMGAEPMFLVFAAAGIEAWRGARRTPSSDQLRRRASSDA